MEINRLTRVTLNNLSKEVFGTSSRWEKLVSKGFNELVTEEVTETVPGEKGPDGVVSEPTTRQVRVPVLRGGSQQFVRKVHTVESVMELMQEQKKQLEFIKAKYAEFEAEQNRKREEAALIDKVNKATAGSAV